MPRDAKLRESLSSMVCDLIRIPSLSGKETDVANYVGDAIRERGFSFDRDGNDNIVCIVGKGSQRLHINGHMDTVPPVPGWSEDPFQPLVSDDTILGLGASDMKSGLAVMLHLLSMIEPKVEVVFSFVVCEEGSGGGKGDGTVSVAEHWPGNWAITLEASCMPDGPTIGLGTQGHSSAVVSVAGRAAHSSRPELGDNALSKAAIIIQRVDAVNATYKPILLRDGVSARSSMAVTTLHGGTVSNIIPDRADLTISRRTAPGETREDFEEEMSRITQGINATTRIRHGSPAAVVDLDGPLFMAAKKAFEGVFDRSARYSFTRGRTDLVIFGERGMDVLNIGPGLIGEAHTANEIVYIDHLAETTRMLARLISTIA